MKSWDQAAEHRGFSFAHSSFADYRGNFPLRLIAAKLEASGLLLQKLLDGVFMLHRAVVLVSTAIFLLVVGAISTPAQYSASTPEDAATLRDGTPIRLHITKMLSSANSLAGDKVSFAVAQDVEINGKIVIAKGATAAATVMFAEPPKGHGHDGKLVIHLDYVTLTDGETIEVRTHTDNKATAAEQSLLAAPDWINSRESPAMQYLHGRNRAFGKDSEFPVFVSGDAPLALSRFKSAAESQANARQELTRLELSSYPNNAEVDVDGKFISVTPAIIGLSPGAHMISVRSAGFQTWRQSLEASGGTVTKQVRLQQGGVNGSVLSNCWGGTDCSDSVGDVADAAKRARANEASPQK
jgi:PEGA domain